MHVSSNKREQFRRREVAFTIIVLNDPSFDFLYYRNGMTQAMLAEFFCLWPVLR